ncbi:MAG: cytoplasmic protein, partial [Anaerolineae bacterium]
PTGGNLNDVRLTETIIASHDIVAADAYAATLFDLKGSDIVYVRTAAEMGLGTLDLDSVKIEEIAVG